jgi:hypothetical protein
MNVQNDKIENARFDAVHGRQCKVQFTSSPPPLESGLSKPQNLIIVDGENFNLETSAVFIRQLSRKRP